MGRIRFPWQQTTQRIFISYRRDDSQWVAGRLCDSLGGYFGDARVFRDIDDIAGGARFGEVIEQSLESADAVIVLIGRGWLDAVDHAGRRRLDDSQDWVAQEVATALSRGIPVYPVLVDDAAMPRKDDLPPDLQPLTHHNAIALNDNRWQSDVSRLAQIIALDIPSATERQLHWVNLLVSGLLFAAIAYTMTAVVGNLLAAGESLRLVGGNPAWSFAQLFDTFDDGTCRSPPVPGLIPLNTAQAGLVFLVMVPASALLFVFARAIEFKRRPLFLAAAWTGALGSFVTFILFYPVCAEYEPLVIFYLGMLFAPLMLVLMGLSGFRAK